MKIAILGLSPNVGGVETFIINVYRELKKRGHSFYFFVSTSEKIIKEDEIINNGDFIIRYTSRRKNYFQFRKDLNHIFSINNFDIFWLNCCSLSCIDELKYAYKYKVPVRIVHSHNSENMGSKVTNVLHNRNKKVINKYVTHYFACSKVAAQWMFPQNAFEKAYIFHNAIDIQKYTYDEEKMLNIRKKFNIDIDTMVIGHAGRFHFQKNHLFLLKVYSEYHKINTNSILVLCGDGELKKDIINEIEKLNISENVLLLGNRDDMPDIYQMFDLFLFPSLFEGLPFVLVEAQAAGIPCLISDTISSEIKMTDLIHFSSLDDTPYDWAIKLKLLDSVKKNTEVELKNAGYDIVENGDKICHMLEENIK